MTVLDLGGTTTAKEERPGIWHITRIDPFGKKHIVILTNESIKYLAEQVQVAWDTYWQFSSG